MSWKIFLQSLPFSKSIERLYGGKRPAFRSAQAWLDWRLGKVAKYEHIDWNRASRLVFVCLGNICRSPFGQVVAQRLSIPSASCGLGAREGESANPSAREAAQRRGYSLTEHRAQNFDAFGWKSDDVVVVFELEQALEAERRLKMCPGLKSLPQIVLLGLWARPRRPFIQDPYSLVDGYFDTCYRVIEDAVIRMITKKAANEPQQTHASGT